MPIAKDLELLFSESESDGEGPVQVMLPDLIAHAMQDVGVTEIPGVQNNARILKMHSYTSLKAKDDETAWCAATMCAWLEECNYRSPRSARAADFIDWGFKSVIPVFGCVLIFVRRDPHGMVIGHHVCLYMGETDVHYWGLGGNQNNQVGYGKFLKADLVAAVFPE